MPVVQAAIPDVCPRVELIGLRWLILIDLISSVVENHTVSTINKLEPFSFLVLSGWLKSLSFTCLWLCGGLGTAFDFLLLAGHSSCIACLTTIFTYLNLETL